MLVTRQPCGYEESGITGECMLAGEKYAQNMDDHRAAVTCKQKIFVALMTTPRNFFFLGKKLLYGSLWLY